MLSLRLDPESRGKFVENSPVTLRTWSSEGVREPVIGGTDPGRFGPVIVFDLVDCTNTSHAETIVERRAAPAEQVVATLIICFNSNVRMSHSRAPDPDNQHMRQ